MTLWRRKPSLVDSWQFGVPRGLSAWWRCRQLEAEIGSEKRRHFDETVGMVEDVYEPIGREHADRIEAIEAELLAIRSHNLVRWAEKLSIEVPPIAEWHAPPFEGLHYLDWKPFE